MGHFTLYFFLFFAVFDVRAEAPSKSLAFPQIVAVQTRPDSLNQELSVHVSYLPMDHFNTYLVFGGSYSRYFSDYLGWEALNLNIAKDRNTGLDNELQQKYRARPDQSAKINYYITSSIIYTPLYMKHLFMGEKIIWGDVSFIGGGGVANLEDNGNQGMVDLGLAIRFFTADKWTYKLDLRQFLFLSSAVKPNMALTFGVSYNFGGTLIPKKVDSKE